MALSEFKAWFEGYTEGLEAAPTKAQFDRIKEKVKEISGTPITYPVFVDRYRDYQPHFWGHPAWIGLTGNVGFGTSLPHMEASSSVLSFSVAGAAPEADRYKAGSGQTVEWDSHAAMYAVGKADAVSEAA